MTNETIEKILSKLHGISYCIDEEKHIIDRLIIDREIINNNIDKTRKELKELYEQRILLRDLLPQGHKSLKSEEQIMLEEINKKLKNANLNNLDAIFSDYTDQIQRKIIRINLTPQEESFVWKYIKEEYFSWIRKQ